MTGFRLGASSRYAAGAKVDAVCAPEGDLLRMAAESDHDNYSADWARQHLPDYGPEWRAAIDFGIDVTLLLENLELSPTERLERLRKTVEFHDLLRSARATK